MVIGVTTVTLVYNVGDHVDDLGDRDDDHDGHDANHDDADNDGRPDGRPIIRAVGPEGRRTSNQISISTTIHYHHCDQTTSRMHARYISGTVTTNLGRAGLMSTSDICRICRRRPKRARFLLSRSGEERAGLVCENSGYRTFRNPGYRTVPTLFLDNPNHSLISDAWLFWAPWVKCLPGV